MAHVPAASMSHLFSVYEVIELGCTLNSDGVYSVIVLF